MYLHHGEVILVNGFAANQSFWHNFMTQADEAKLFHAQKVCIIDLDKPLSRIGWQNHIRSRLTPDCLLIGWSLGGMLAVDAIAQLPESRFPKGLVLLNSAPGFHQDHWAAGMAAATFADFHQLIEVSLEQLVKQFSFLLVQGSDQLKTDRRWLRANFNTASLPDLASLNAGMHLLGELNLQEAWSAIRCPAFLVGGEKDRLFTAESVSLSHQLNPAMKLEIIPGLGHFPCQAQASKVIASMGTFLNAIQ